MGEVLNVDSAVLEQAAAGITATIDTLSDLGLGETGATGRGFSMLKLSTMEAGSLEVQKSMEEFAERWSWGVRYLVQAANSIAQMLGLSAGRYHIMDETTQEMLKTSWTHLAGNPHLSSDEIAARDWGETFADNPINNVLNADYSRESFDQAFDHIDVNNEIIAEVAPQAMANLNPSYDPTGAGLNASYNSGAADRAAEIRQSHQN